MFLVDDIITAPFKAVLWILRKVVDAAQEEQMAQEDRIKETLRELYMRLETGQLSEQEFDAEERVLLDRLDEIEAARAAEPAGEGDADDEEGEGDDEEGEGDDEEGDADDEDEGEEEHDDDEGESEA